MPPIAPGPPLCEELRCEVLARAAVVEPSATITASPALSVPVTGVTAACVPLTRSTCTRIAFALPLSSTNTTPLFAFAFPPAFAAVWPHGELCDVAAAFPAAPHHRKTAAQAHKVVQPGRAIPPRVEAR